MTDPADDLDDLVELADIELTRRKAARVGKARRSGPPSMESSMFASKFELPDYFGARVSAIHEHLTEAQSTENNRNRREALRKGLNESCSLLQDIDMGAVSYELEQLLEGSQAVNDIPPPPGALERFLKVERQLLTEIGVSGAAIEDIDRLVRQLRREPRTIITPDDMVVQFRRLQELVCARTRDGIQEARAIGDRSVWFGVAGATLVVLNVGAVSVAIPVATLSAAVGGGLISRALG
jgi:hypothetical protein